MSRNNFFSRVENNTFYVLYPFVNYLLTVPRIIYLRISGPVTVRIMRSEVLATVNISTVLLSSGVKHCVVCLVDTDISQHEPLPRKCLQ
jgi:hypothetical protein